MIQTSDMEIQNAKEINLKPVENIKNTVVKIITSVLCLIMIIVSSIYLHRIPVYIGYASIVVFALLGVLIPFINSEKMNAIFKLLIVSAISLIALYIVYTALYTTGVLTSLKDLEKLTNFIRRTGYWGVFVYILIVIFQVIVLPLPGIVPAIIGSTLYGPTRAFIYMTIGTLVGSLIAFGMGKIFGKKLVSWMIGSEKTEKYAKIVNDKGKIIFIVMLLFPFFPDDILCMVAGLTTMSYKYFMTVVSITRPIMIAFYCYFGTGSIIPFSGWGIPVWIALFAITVLLLILATRLKNNTLVKRKDKKIKEDDKTKI